MKVLLDFYLVAFLKKKKKIEFTPNAFFFRAVEIKFPFIFFKFFKF